MKAVIEILRVPKVTYILEIFEVLTLLRGMIVLPTDTFTHWYYKNYNTSKESSMNSHIMKPWRSLGCHENKLIFKEVYLEPSIHSWEIIENNEPLEKVESVKRRLISYKGEESQKLRDKRVAEQDTFIKSI